MPNGQTDPWRRYEVLAIGAVALLTLASALRYGAYFYPYLNSDMAMHVLMARDFDWEHSLWYWGQTRLGSLLPFLASIPWHFGLDPLKAVTLVQYAMVSVSIVLFGLCARNAWAALLFAMLFLFPAPPDVYLIVPGHPYLPHLMLTLAGVFVLQWYDGRKSLIGAGLIVLFWAIGLMAVWVSDMALVTVPLILMWRMYGVHGAQPRKWSRTFAGWTVVLGPVALYACAKMLKRTTIDWSGYTGQGLASPDLILKGLKALAQRCTDQYLSFSGFGLTQADSLVWWAIASLVAGVLIAGGEPVRSKVHLLFGHVAGLFMILAVVLWLAVICSAWAAASEYDSRYFSLPGLLFCMAALSAHSLVKSAVFRTLCILLSSSALILGNLSFSEHWTATGAFRADVSSRDRVDMMQHSTILGDYWYCYTMAAYNCNEVIPLAFDEQFFRNAHQVDAAFLSDSIFVCTDPVHPTLPDTLRQHGRTLARTSEPSFAVGNTTLGRYMVTLQPQTKPHRQ